MDQLGKAANHARAQLDREMSISLSAFAPENLVSRDGFGSPAPRQPAHLHTQAESGACLRVTGFPPCSAAATPQQTTANWMYVLSTTGGVNPLHFQHQRNYSTVL